MNRMPHDGADLSGAPLELPGSSPVTIRLLDGSQRQGRLARFSAANASLMLEPNRAAAADAKTTLLRAEDVACVGFHRTSEFSPTPPLGSEKYRVRIAAGEVMHVQVLPGAVSNALGFWGYPTSSDTAYAVVMFYRHGVSSREKDAPLGALLVSTGVLGRGALEQGLAAQQASRSVPIGQILVEMHKVDKETVDEAAELQKRKRMRIGEVLQEAGLLSAADLEHALAEQKARKGKRLGELLVELGFLRERDLSTTLALKFDLPFINLDEVAVNPAAALLVGPELISKYGVLPLDYDATTLTVAIGDPSAVDAIDALRLHAQRRIRDVLATPTQLKQYVMRWLADYQRQSAGSFDTTVSSILQNLTAGDVGGEPDEDESKEANTPREDESGIIKLVNQIILDAYRRGASDIHIEPNGKDRPIVVRFRIDGECAHYEELPSIVRSALVSRIKILAKLDISEKRKPQDGKIRFRLPDRQVELRVATIPSVNNNEDVVMRILAASKPLPLTSMGLSPRNLQDLIRASSQPYGLILCVGPTGSGKTTTLHSILGHLNNVETKIWTAEDPVEITQPGLRQVQVQSKIGFTFAAAMRAFLRADPDVIMVGEMRDQETASTAIEASLTGHLVLSTLHTNTAPETITRLLDMGLDPFSFGDALVAILAQRLARTLCVHCRVRQQGSAEEFEEITRFYGPELFKEDTGVDYGENFVLFRPKGCDACSKTGYKGRFGLHELLVANDEIKQAIAERAPVERIRRCAIASGMRTLLQDGVQKALAGQTDLKQVLAVCSR